MGDKLRKPMPKISRRVTSARIKDVTYTLSQSALEEMAVEYIKHYPHIYIDVDGEWSFQWCEQYDTDTVYLEVSCATRSQEEVSDE